MELRPLVLIALAGCATQSKRLVVPEDMRKVTAGPTVAASTAAPAPVQRASTTTTGALGPDTLPAQTVAPRPVTTTTSPLKLQPAPVQSATAPEQKYVLRLVEHGRTWEVELPEDTGGYEVRIPLGSKIEAPTLADQELLGKDPKAQKPLPPKSYLAGMAKIAEMYAAHRYELALIEAVDLGQQYPKEARIEAMKGSLFQRLGKTELARESWKKALELDPSDTTVAEALRGLKGE